MEIITLSRRNIPLGKIGTGRLPALPSQVETDLENCIKAKARMGYPCNKDEIKTLVGEYVNSHNIKTPFVDGMPGDDWYYSFMRRHPTLSFKKPELLQKNRMDARDPYVIYDFFNELECLVNNSDLNDKPSFVFNCDETGFASDPKKTKSYS
ncbi:hypothetical protein NQ314_021053 [Rhamnusium bicolor]|uniref:HTH CENPB-type domain-containing protein n=1 Tax=Rhamnusium bicolor TaxID=1586634 RepID=A0AAV8WIE0_9CUCU|nr:hypothetical protein NQ314_021053 [Rhamnusium bicolor]